MYLTDIYSDYSVEDTNYECKARFDRENNLGWLKTVCGFANGQGGTLFLGVEDKTNKLIGFEQNKIDAEKQFFYNQIKEHFQTIPQIETTLLEYTIKNSIRYIIKIDIYESNIKPVILKYQQLPMIFIRRDGYTSTATTEEVITMSLNNKKVEYDSQPTDIKFNINDFNVLKSFYHENTGRELKEKELASISFFDDNNNLMRGSLLFKDDYKDDNSKIVCSVYKGLTRGDDTIIASNTFSGNLISCYNFAYTFIQQRMNHGFIKKATSRVDIDSFPQRSLFEALINALAHRDYFITGSAIYVDLFINRLVITSPGGYYSVGDLKKTTKLVEFISKRRNKLISDVFVLCKAMEAKGTGFEKIIDDYKDQDVYHKPYIYAKNNQFSIVLPDITYSDGVTLDDDSIFVIGESSFGKYDLSILSFCYQKHQTVKSIVEYLNVSNSTFFRKQILGNLVNKNLLIEDNSTKTSNYITNQERVKIR